MVLPRLIAVLTLAQGGIVIQPVRFKLQNPIHSDARHAVEAFEGWEADELILLDVSREPQRNLPEIIERVTETCFIPTTCGGWITDMEYADHLVRAGADKITVNTVLHDDPDFITELADTFGRQAVVVSIDVKDGEAVVDRGRRRTGVSALSAALRASSLGAGEILLNDVDHDGARKGYNLPLLKEVCEAVDIPVIAFGGAFRWGHLIEGVEVGASAVAAANVFHYTEGAIRKAKAFMRDAGIEMRSEILL